MGFFDDAPPSRERHGAGAGWSQPKAEFPHVALADAVILARTQEVAVAITAIWAFSTGFEFWMAARFQQDVPLIADVDDQPSLLMRIGVQFADGRRVANLGQAPEPSGSMPSGLLLRPMSFGGSRLDRNRSYWVWPLPPPGPLTFAFEWAAFDIGEGRVEVDAQLIIDAATRSVPIWDDDTENG
jgi:hypothetical protein